MALLVIQGRLRATSGTSSSTSTTLLAWLFRLINSWRGRLIFVAVGRLALGVAAGDSKDIIIIQQVADFAHVDYASHISLVIWL